jgi:hypothetical protein
MGSETLVKLSIACADVGSVSAGNFGWAICDPPAELQALPDQASIESFADAVVERLRKGRSVAVGFECPLFVPLRQEPSLLTSARAGEGNRAWSAGAGCGSLATGLVETAWVLKRLRSQLAFEPSVSFSWSDFLNASKPGLLLWEAFVSRASKAETHRGDAELAVRAFVRALPDPGTANVVHEDSVFSLAGAALLRTGWSVPVSMLEAACLVLAA